MRQLPLLRKPPIDLTRLERALWSQGFKALAGVDEVGRGCLAGPVVAAAVMLPVEKSISGLNDSKKISPTKREHLFEEIQATAISLGLGSVSVEEIDATDILRASLQAMRKAVDQLNPQPDHLLIDGTFPIQHELSQSTHIKGDSLSQSIAAASIIAKVTRDRMMCAYEEQYPAFRFSIHKGYGTEQHRKELARYGPTPIHRRTFKGVVV